MAGTDAVDKAALPVTLLSGFLGSGKTTLLKHILETDHGLKIAVIVNDIGGINVDAALINRTHQMTHRQEKVIALQNGCICCTLRGDLLEEIVRLSTLQQFDYVLIESSGISEPEQIAETFDGRLAAQMVAADDLDDWVATALKTIQDAGGLDHFARLDTTVTVVDAFTLLHDFDTDDMLSTRRTDVQPQDERTVSDLLVDQIEFADVIVLNKTDLVRPAERQRIRELVQKLNHRARILETSYGRVDVAALVNTGLFSLERAQTGYGWLEDLHDMTQRAVDGCGEAVPVAPREVQTYDLRNFVYVRRRPFHPQRLYQLLYDKFILLMEDDEGEDEDEQGDDRMEDDEDEEEDDDEDDAMDEADQPFDLVTPPNDTILATKRASPLFRRLYRSKGEFFLATRPHRAGDWSQAGTMLTLTGGRPWFCTLPEEDYLTGDASVDRLVRHDITSGGEWGDRRQELVLIGEALDKPALAAVLDACLLTDAEFAQWEAVMREPVAADEENADLCRQEVLQQLFQDGFPDWPEMHDHGHDHDHDHDHGHKH